MSLFVVTRFSGSRRAAAPLVNRDREGAGATFTRSLTVAVHQKPSGHASHADPLKRVTTNKSAKRAAQKVLHNKRLFECRALRPPISLTISYTIPVFKSVKLRSLTISRDSHALYPSSLMCSHFAPSTPLLSAPSQSSRSVA